MLTQVFTQHTMQPCFRVSLRPFSCSAPSEGKKTDPESKVNNALDILSDMQSEKAVRS